MLSITFIEQLDFVLKSVFIETLNDLQKLYQ